MQFLIETTLGNITIELDAKAAPVSAKNFADYVSESFYDGTVFHRVIPTFMIQGGGHTADLAKKQTKGSIQNEWRNGLKNLRGAVSYARLGGNPDSATSQFFINVVDNPFLDNPQSDGAAYAVFGKVVDGMDVVDKIRVVPTGHRGGMGDVPVKPVMIESIRAVAAAV